MLNDPTLPSATQVSQTSSEPPPRPKLAYRVHEAAEILGVCDDTIYNLLKRGALKSCSKLRHKLIPATELERFVRS